MSELPTPQGYVARHKKAFRTAFDFLNAHFPPTWDSVWWKKVAEDMCSASDENANEQLTEELLMAVFNYLEKEMKLRKVEENQ